MTENRFTKQYIDLAQERLKGKVLFATDDYFAAKENLIKSGRGIFIENKFTGPVDAENRCAPDEHLE